MTSDSPENNCANKLHLATVFEWMPVCALVIDLNGTIQDINQNAIHFFRATTKEDFIFDMENIKSSIIDPTQISELIKSICISTEPVKKTVLIRRFDKTVAAINLTARLFPNETKLILIQFSEQDKDKRRLTYEISEVFQRETQKLRPYLNKPGKDLLNELAFNNLLNKDSKTGAFKILLSEFANNQLTTLLSQQFPQLSNNDLIICELLANKLTIDEISILTGKTPNSLRVTLHRIVQKTNYSSSKEFLRKIHSVINIPITIFVKDECSQPK